MNGANLKKPSETDWERIDQMSDEEIDTSDISPLDDSFFVSAQWRMPKWITVKQFQESRLIGLWKDREDIQDSSDYTRQLREQTQQRNQSDGSE
ncbi:MAG: hypothetical protein ACRD82_12570 [Blastocatellia bacterium]